jgi:hypothetical protein
VLVATDDPQVFRVSFRDQTEEAEVELTQNEIIEALGNRSDSWLFVGHHIWDMESIVARGIPSDAEMTFLLRDVSTDTYRVEYADASGFSVYYWTKGQIVEQANDTCAGDWVFVDHQMVTPLMIAEYDFQPDTTARFLPGLVGGPRQYSISVDGEFQELSWTQINQHVDNGFELFLDGAHQHEPDHSSLIEAANGEKPIQLRSDMVKVIVGPAEKVLMRRCEFERITREFTGSVLAIKGSQILRNGGIDTLCPTPDFVFENLWSGSIPSLVLVAKACTFSE